MAVLAFLTVLLHRSLWDFKSSKQVRMLPSPLAQNCVPSLSFFPLPHMSLLLSTLSQGQKSPRASSAYSSQAVLS